MHDSSDAVSYVMLTLHKAGSAFAAEILRNVFSGDGRRTFDIATEAFDAGLDEYSYVMQKIHLLKEVNGFFGPFRGESVGLVSKISGLVPIIHIRDPRDCLVSNYYSICFSHVLPGPGPERERFEAMRSLYRRQTVDEFCLNVLTNGDRTFHLLRSAAEENTTAIISRYEHMVADFRKWLRDLLQRVRIELSDEDVAALDTAGDIPLVEEIYNHRRQVTPGDFRRKLQHSTQTKLTDFFRSDLLYFGYSVYL